MKNENGQMLLTRAPWGGFEIGDQFQVLRRDSSFGSHGEPSRTRITNCKKLLALLFQETKYVARSYIS